MLCVYGHIRTYMHNICAILMHRPLFAATSSEGTSHSVRIPKVHKRQLDSARKKNRFLYKRKNARKSCGARTFERKRPSLRRQNVPTGKCNSSIIISQVGNAKNKCLKFRRVNQELQPSTGAAEAQRLHKTQRTPRPKHARS